MNRIVSSNLDEHFNSLKKTGSMDKSKPLSAVKSIIKHASAQVTRQTADYYHPLYEPTNLQLPTKVREINQWARYFYRTDPVVGTATELHCLPPGTPVCSNPGVMDIEKIKPGDKVMSMDGSFQEVKRSFEYDYDGDMYDFKAVCVPMFSTTDKHRILVKRGIRKDVEYAGHQYNNQRGKRYACTYHEKINAPSGGPEWVPARDVRERDYLIVPKYRTVKNATRAFDLASYVVPGGNGCSVYKVGDKSIIPANTKTKRVKRYISPNEDLASLLGWYVSEGAGKKIAYFCVGGSEEDAAWVSSLILKVFGFRASRDMQKPHNIRVMACSSPVARFLSDICGSGARNKRIPDFIMKASPEIGRAFMRAYISGDGCMKPKYDMSMITVSRTLAYQLLMLGTKFGVLFSMSSYDHRKYKKNASIEYVLRASKSKVLPAIYGKRSDIRKKTCHNVYEDENNFYVPVRTIRKRRYVGKIHDIETEDHSFAIPVVVHNSEFPITGMRNVCEDPKIKRFFDDMAFDVLEIEKLMSYISLEWWKLGNVFPFGMWDDSEARWKKFICLNPDYVEIEMNVFAEGPVLKLDPDDSLKKIVQTKKPIEIYNRIDPQIRAYIARGEKVPLSNFKLEIEDSRGRKDNFEFPQVTHLARRNSMYESYGLPPSYRAFKVLIYKDMIRRAQFSIAKRHWRPIKVVKVGSDEYPADEATLANVTEAVNEASQDPNAWLVWHHSIAFDYISSAGKVIPLGKEYEWVDKEIYAAMGINRAMIEGSGPTFANASIGLQVLINRYMRFQKMLANWIENSVYKPVARAQQFYRTNEDSGDRELIVPKVEWEMMRLKDDAQQKTLLQALQQKGIISKQTLLVYLGIDPEKEAKLIKEEKEKAVEDQKETGTPPPKAPTAPSPAPVPRGPLGLVPELPEVGVPGTPGAPGAGVPKMPAGPGEAGGLPGETKPSAEGV